MTRTLPAAITTTLLCAVLAGCGSDPAGQPAATSSSVAPSSAPATTKAPRNEVECVNINRAHNAWDSPSLLYTADQIADMNEFEVQRAMEAGKKYLDNVSGYDDQPSKVLASAIAEYNYEMSFLNLQVVIGEGVEPEQARKVEASVTKVISSYRAWKSAICD